MEFACEGEPYYEFDAEAAQALLAEAGYPDGFETDDPAARAAVRTYLPDPPVIAQEIQAQLKANLNIDATIDIQESGTLLDDSGDRPAGRLYLLGWNADYPGYDQLPGLSTSHPAGSSSADPIPELVDASGRAPRLGRPGGSGGCVRGRQQHHPRAGARGRDRSHGASAAAFKADVEGAHSSPLAQRAVLGHEGRRP